MSKRLEPTELGYSAGRSVKPGGVDLWIRADRSTRVIGPMGSGKTMRLLAPALREHPGAGLATSTKADLYELTVVPRRRLGPVVAMDPLGIVPGAPPMRWSPIYGAHDSRVAETRARAFAAGARSPNSTQSEGGQFYRQRAGTLLMCLLQAAALDGASLRDLLRWAQRPSDPAPRRVLDRHPAATAGWSDKLAGLLTGDDRTVGNTLASVEQALAPFDHEDVIRAVDVSLDDCTDLRQLILARGTVYALGKDSAYGSVAPLMTAIVEDVLDTAEQLGYESTTGRLDPSFLAALDEAPNICPIPSLKQRVADGRGRGIAVIYAAQGWAGVVSRWGEHEAAELAASTSNVIVYGGCKDPEFLADMEKLCGMVKVTKKTRSTSRGSTASHSTSTQEVWEPVMRAHEVGQLNVDRGHALLFAENLPPVITRMRALFERGKEWHKVIQPELDEVRRENTDARVRRDAEREAESARARAAWNGDKGGTSASSSAPAEARPDGAPVASLTEA